MNSVDRYPVEQVNVHEIFRIIRKRRLTIGLVTVIVLGIALAAASMREPMYEAKAMIKINPFSIASSEKGGGIGVIEDILGQANRRSIGTLAAIIQAPAVLKKVHEENFNSFKSPAQFDKLKVSASQIEETNLLEIKVIWQDRRDATLFANALVKKVNEICDADTTGAISKALLYVQNRKEEVIPRLREAENKLVKFRKQANTVSLTPGSEQEVGQLAGLEVARTNSKTTLAATNAQTAMLQGYMKRVQPTIRNITIERNPIIEQLKSEITKLQIAKLALLTTKTEKHPQVMQLESQIQAYTKKIQSEAALVQKQTTETPDPLYQQLSTTFASNQANAAAEQARLKAIESFIGQQKAKVAALPDKQQQFNVLMREKGILEQLYMTLEQQEQRLTLESSRQVSPTTVISAAIPSSSALQTSTRVLLMAGLLAGLIFGVAMALFQEYMTDTIDTEEQVERLLELPLLGSIPRIGDPKHRVIYKLPGSHAEVEGYRFLSANILPSSNGQSAPGAQRLLFTSTGSGSGNSTTVLNLAVSMAERGKRVILVDMDLRKPSLHRHFNAMPSPGITDVLMGDKAVEDVLLPTDNDHLIFVPAGSMVANPIPLLSSPRLGEVFEEIGRLADVLMIDSPPCITVVDASLIAAETDGAILVMGAGSTARKAARRARMLMENIGAKIVGVILNRSGEPSDNYYYYQPYRKQRREQRALPGRREIKDRGGRSGSAPQTPRPSDLDMNRTQVLKVDQIQPDEEDRAARSGDSNRFAS
ncbi:MAG: polysaccharide biosynthesis tyrosine autokinase [Armatimonadetes bacterium]|nr:polysaccharide biosynthesis tyrosine autokinase [Armatimonadota bacterium]